MVDPAMNAAMAETALWAVLSLHRGFYEYAAQQRMRRWHPLVQSRADEVKRVRLAAHFATTQAPYQAPPPTFALSSAIGSN